MGHWPAGKVLAMLGLEDRREQARQQFSAVTLSELLGVTTNRIRAWVSTGLIKPSRVDFSVASKLVKKVTHAPFRATIKVKASAKRGKIRRAFR